MAEPVQALWIGRPLTRIEQLSITSFLRHGHEYHLYCYDRVANVPPEVVVKDGNEILPASEIFFYQQGPGRGSVASFSDLFRYKLLLERGGWWADTDVVCVKPFDFPEPLLFAAEHAGEKQVKVATAVIKLPAGHRVAARCYEAAAAADRSTLSWGQIGPDLLSRMVVEEGLQQALAHPVVFCPIPWWEWRAVLAEDAQRARALVTDHTHAIHLWHENWRREGLGEALTFPPTSLFAQLLRDFGVHAIG